MRWRWSCEEQGWCGARVSIPGSLANSDSRVSPWHWCWLTRVKSSSFRRRPWAGWACPCRPSRWSALRRSPTPSSGRRIIFSPSRLVTSSLSWLALYWFSLGLYYLSLRWRFGKNSECRVTEIGLLLFFWAAFPWQCQLDSSFVVCFGLQGLPFSPWFCFWPEKVLFWVILLYIDFDDWLFH